MTWLRSSLVADRASDRQRRSCWHGAVPESRWQAELRINPELAEAIGGAGGTAITVTCDVSDEDAVRSAAASGQLPFVITNIGPNLLTLTGTVSGEVNPTVPQWSSRTIASNGTILYFT